MTNLICCCCGEAKNHGAQCYYSHAAWICKSEKEFQCVPIQHCMQDPKQLLYSMEGTIIQWCVQTGSLNWDGYSRHPSTQPQCMQWGGCFKGPCYSKLWPHSETRYTQKTPIKSLNLAKESKAQSMDRPKRKQEEISVSCITVQCHPPSLPLAPTGAKRPDRVWSIELVHNPAESGISTAANVPSKL